MQIEEIMVEIVQYSNLMTMERKAIIMNDLEQLEKLESASVRKLECIRNLIRIYAQDRVIDHLKEILSAAANDEYREVL